MNTVGYSINCVTSAYYVNNIDTVSNGNCMFSLNWWYPTVNAAIRE